MFRFTLTLLVALVCIPTVRAHYPWFMIDSKEGKNGTLNFYFEEGVRAGDGQYLDPFIKDGTFWIRGADNKAATLKLDVVKKPGKRWLSTMLEVPQPRAIDCYCKWGVYQGKLLYYYAKHIDAPSPDQFQKLGRAEKLKFDLVPRMVDGKVEVQALWEGKPRAGLSVNVAGPQFRQTLKTDEKGMIQFPAKNAGLYSMRTMFIEPDPAGKDNGQDYKGLRQTATLTMTLPGAGG